MAKIRITAGRVSQTATLNDSVTSALLLENLPVQASAQRWGDEIYFDVPLETGPEDAQAQPAGKMTFSFNPLQGRLLCCKSCLQQSLRSVSALTFSDAD